VPEAAWRRGAPVKSYPPVKTGIALGSNLGDRTAHLAAARHFLSTLHEGPHAPLCSGLYETEPVDCAPDTAPFLNAVVEIETSLTAEVLLPRLRAYETIAGRASTHPKNSPRPIDLDLLYAGDRRVTTPSLILPHPRLTARRFVLQPLADIRGDLVLPGGNETVSVLLARLPAAPAVQLVARRW
jgi:2-amino-4-hydroxy-6-hydroxymethyldihydropteridine diphosphokinase